MKQSLKYILYFLIINFLLLQLLNVVVLADDFDDEELVGDHLAYTTATTSNNDIDIEEPIIEIPEPKPINVLTRKKLQISDFYGEIFICISIVLYLINYFIGKIKNENIAKYWMSMNIQIFKHNFSLIGNENGKALIKDGPADYLFYLSGRRNCKYIHGRITVKHDLLQTTTDFILTQFTPNVKLIDTITYQIFMNDHDYDDFVFAVTKKSASKSLVDEFTKKSNNNLLPSTLNVHSESIDVTETILTKFIVDLLKETEDYLIAFIISDQPRIRPEKPSLTYPKTITVIHEIKNDPAEIQRTLKITELTMLLIDLVSTRCSFAPETKNKFKRNREEANKRILKSTEAERLEAIQQKKVEKKRSEAERIAKLSPEEQRKV
ncbi:12216_t:CDS:10 [Entrophospora sp. SA101]|nr:12216_t:CDS:10 [Entrophospora sp. SA101]CAJ0832726.1 6031_t:CDS:10 [Entrophospora sp. SA101]